MVTAAALGWQHLFGPAGRPPETGPRANAAATAPADGARSVPPPPAALPPPPAAPSDVDAATAGPPVLLQAPVISQLPQLRNGCEVTSLAMLLQAVGDPVDKMALAQRQPTDPTPPVFGTPGVFATISRWGNPDKAYVGSPTGYGYGIYHAPLARLLEQELPGRSLDLSGRPFGDVVAQLRNGIPVVLWTTTTMRPPTSWVTWQSPDGPVRATQLEHAVLLVGASARGLVVNNPLTGRQELVPTASFVAAWQAMGRQAVSVRPGPPSSSRLRPSSERL